jgi:hypothetical protein
MWIHCWLLGIGSEQVDLLFRVKVHMSMKLYTYTYTYYILYISDIWIVFYQFSFVDSFEYFCVHICISVCIDICIHVCGCTVFRFPFSVVRCSFLCLLVCLFVCLCFEYRDITVLIEMKNIKFNNKKTKVDLVFVSKINKFNTKTNKTKPNKNISNTRFTNKRIQNKQI